MSKTLLYQIEFFNYWHSGSGLSGSTYADSIVKKTERNLPFIPGKTVKGLLRHAAERIYELNTGFFDQNFIKDVFGQRSDDEKAKKEDEGKAFFTNALLSEELTEKILESPLSENLYTVLSFTQIDEHGQASDGSLRQLEVTIPVTLYAAIEHFPEKYEKEIQHCMNWIKEMGQNRNRGLGRCKFSLLK